MKDEGRANALVEPAALDQAESVTLNLVLLRRWRNPAVGFAALAILCGSHAAEPTMPVKSPTAKTAATTKLFQAAQVGDLALLRAAIAEGADVNGHEASGLPPLLTVLRNATGALNDTQRQCIACLLENGAAVDPTDELRRTPLIHAARLGDFETVRVLVECEAYVKARDALHKTALFYAVEANRRDLVLYLASHGDLVSLTIKERKLLATH